MKLYSILSDHSQKTGHFIIDDPRKPAHEEEVDLTRILIIEEKHGGIYIDRYQADGKWLGDTWHKTIEDAKYQAEFEFKDLLGEWITIPDDIKDATDYIFEQLNIKQTN